MVNLFWRPEPWRVQFPSSISDMGFSGNILPWDLIVHQFIQPSFSLFEYGLWGFNPFSDTPISLSLYVYIYICIHIMYLPIYLKKKTYHILSPWWFYSSNPWPDSSFTQPSRCVLSHRVTTDGLYVVFHQDADRFTRWIWHPILGRKILY